MLTHTRERSRRDAGFGFREGFFTEKREKKRSKNKPRLDSTALRHRNSRLLGGGFPERILDRVSRRVRVSSAVSAPIGISLFRRLSRARRREPRRRRPRRALRAAHGAHAREERRGDARWGLRARRDRRPEVIVGRGRPPRSRNPGGRDRPGDAKTHVGTHVGRRRCAVGRDAS